MGNPRIASPACLLVIASLPLPAQAWQTLQPRARGSSAACYDPVRGVTVCFGGTAEVNNPTVLGETWEYDGVGWQQRTTPAALTDRQDAGMAYDPVRGACLLFGGWRAGFLTQTWSWDGETWQHLQPTHTPPGNYEQHLATDWIRSRVVLVTGGSTWEWDGTDWQQVAATAPGSAPLAWDPVAGQVAAFTGTALTRWNGTVWTPVPNSSGVPSRYGAGFACDTVRNRLCVFGGVVAGNFANDLHEWNGTAWVQRPTPVGLDGRSYPGCVFDEARGRLVVWHGESYPSDLADTWEWDGSAWHEAIASPRPTFQFSLANSPNGDQVLLFSNIGLQAMTYTRTAGSWLRRTPATSPATHDGGLAFDPVRNVFLYFGGAIGSTAQATAFDWTNTGWVPRTGPQPPARYGHAMALDVARQRIVLFGGQGAIQYADTWEWDGAAWTAMAPANHPTARIGSRMTFDPVAGQVMLYGGLEGYTSRGDLWHWDGSNWLADGLGAPGPRHEFVMATDPMRGVVVLHGGSRSNAPTTIPHLTDTWLWDGATWQQVAAGVPEVAEKAGMAFDGRAIVMFGGVPDGGSVNGPSGQTLRLLATVGNTASYGTACSGAVTAPTLRAIGQPFAGNPSFALGVSAAAPDSFVVVAASTGTAQIAYGSGCDLLLQSPIGTVAAPTSLAGVARAAVAIPDASALIGAVFAWQAFVVDPQGPVFGLSWSQGLTTQLGG